MNEFINHILQVLRSHGFPHKKVSLPTEKMFEVADRNGLSFNRVLETLREDHQVESQMGNEKIIFSQKLKTPSQEELMKEAQELMNQMSPEELQEMQEMLLKMSPQEKQEMMKKAREMGLL